MNDFLFGRRRYKVIAALVVARTAAGNESYVNRHGLLPANTSQSHIAYLLDNGMIEEVQS